MYYYIQPNKIYCYNNEYKVIVLIICLYVIPQIITINTLTSRMLTTGIALICDSKGKEKRKRRLYTTE